MVDSAATDIDGVRQTCTRAVRAAKGHLHICLKLLGIINKGANPEAPSTMLAEAGGDDLYLAMVMLNSSLLKALHVVDSFQLHCYRELPHGLAVDIEGGPPAEQDELLPFCIDDVQPILPDSQQKSLSGPPRFCGHIGADEAAGPGGSAPERCAQRVGAREYRRLQAQCLILDDSVRAAEQHQELDTQRIARLQEDCRQLRLSLERCAAGLPPLEREKPTKRSKPRQEEAQPETLTISTDDDPLTLTYRRRRVASKPGKGAGMRDRDSGGSSNSNSSNSNSSNSNSSQDASAHVEVDATALHSCSQRARSLKVHSEELRGAAKSSRAVVEAANAEVARIEEEEAAIRKLLNVAPSEDLLAAIKALVDDVGNFDPKAAVCAAGEGGGLSPDADGELPSMHVTSRSAARGRGIIK